MVEPRAFAARIAILRIKAGLSQRELALRANVHEKSLSSWESGARTEAMHLSHIVKIAKAFGLTLAELFDSTAINEAASIRDLYPRRYAGSNVDRRRIQAAVAVGDRHVYCDPGDPRICDECRGLLAVRA